MSASIGPATREDHPPRVWKSEDPHSRETGPHPRHRTLRAGGPSPRAGQGKSKGKRPMSEKSTPDAPSMQYAARPRNRPNAFNHAGFRRDDGAPNLYID